METTTIPTTQAHAALNAILANSLFYKAPRVSRLLRFLVEKALAGTTRDTSEYAIGLDVFDRDPKTYSTGEDPVVRVQVGRLREKLKTYYATSGISDEVEIVIPKGSYMPIFQAKQVVNPQQKLSYLLAIEPFKCISYHNQGGPFTQGLHEELLYQSFKAFGDVLVSHTLFTRNPDDKEESPRFPSHLEVKHLLEGSVQLDAEHIRASIRLVDSSGRITWAEQFHRQAVFTITQHEELASSICCALKQVIGQQQK